MWLHRSVVIWLYALALIPAILRFSFSPFLFFFLHLFLLHSLTKSYQLHRRQLSAIRCRLLTGCILSPPVQQVFVFSFLAFFLGIAVFVYFMISVQGLGNNPDAVNAQAEDFQLWLNSTIQGAVESMNNSEITGRKVAFGTIAVTSASAWETLVAWLLTKGYQSMVTTMVEGQVTAETVTITDIFTFALVGMLGMRIGNSMVSFVVSLLPMYREAWVQLITTPAIQLVRLAQALVSVAIFSISASARILGLRANMSALVAAVFGINVVVNVGGLFWPIGANRVLGVVTWIISVGVLLFAGREVWRRFRIFKAAEVSKLPPRENVEEPLTDDAGRVRYSMIS